MEPCRLLFIQSASIFHKYGGIESYLHDLEELCCDVVGKESVSVILPDDGGKRQSVEAKYAAHFVPRTSQPILRKLENRFSPRLWAAASQQIKEARPSLLICGHVSLGPLVALLSRRFQIPYATIVYGIECWGNMWPQDEYFLRRASAIFSISHWTKQILVKRGYPPDQISIIHPRLPHHLENRPAEIRAVDAAKPLRLLTVSRLDSAERYKGHDHVIEALAQLPKDRFRYRIIGDGPDRDRLQALAKEKRVDSLCEFLPAKKTREELMAAYQDCDVHVMPSRFGFWDGNWKGEGFGIVFVEAAVFGVPGVAYHCGGVTDIIVPNCTGLLVPPDDIDGLAHAFTRLETDRSLVTKLGNEARRHVLENFSEKPISDQIRHAITAAIR